MTCNDSRVAPSWPEGPAYFVQTGLKLPHREPTTGTDPAHDRHHQWISQNSASSFRAETAHWIYEIVIDPPIPDHTRRYHQNEGYLAIGPTSPWEVPRNAQGKAGGPQAQERAGRMVDRMRADGGLSSARSMPCAPSTVRLGFHGGPWLRHKRRSQEWGGFVVAPAVPRWRHSRLGIAIAGCSLRTNSFRPMHAVRPDQVSLGYLHRWTAPPGRTHKGMICGLPFLSVRTAQLSSRRPTARIPRGIAVTSSAPPPNPRLMVGKFNKGVFADLVHFPVFHESHDGILWEGASHAPDAGGHTAAESGSPPAGRLAVPRTERKSRVRMALPRG